MKVLHAARSVLSLAAIVLWLGIVGTLVLYLALVPAVWLAPGRRKASVAAFMKLMSGGIFARLSSWRSIQECAVGKYSL